MKLKNNIIKGLMLSSIVLSLNANAGETYGLVGYQKLGNYDAYGIGLKHETTKKNGLYDRFEGVIAKYDNIGLADDLGLSDQGLKKDGMAYQLDYSLIKKINNNVYFGGTVGYANGEVKYSNDSGFLKLTEDLFKAGFLLGYENQIFSIEGKLYPVINSNLTLSGRQNLKSGSIDIEPNLDGIYSVSLGLKANKDITVYTSLGGSYGKDSNDNISTMLSVQFKL
jgi:hypothetical protein